MQIRVQMLLVIMWIRYREDRLLIKVSFLHSPSFAEMKPESLTVALELCCIDPFQSLSRSTRHQHVCYSCQRLWQRLQAPWHPDCEQ